MLDHTCVRNATRGKQILLFIAIKWVHLPSKMKMQHWVWWQSEPIQISHEMALSQMKTPYNSLVNEFTSFAYISRAHRIYVCVYWKESWLALPLTRTEHIKRSNGTVRYSTNHFFLDFPFRTEISMWNELRKIRNKSIKFQYAKMKKKAFFH